MPTIAHQIKISGTPSAVYKALTTVADLRNWCAAAVTHPTAATAVKQGEAIDMRFGDNKDFRWEFVHLEPDRHVGWQCVAGPDDAAGKGVAFDLAETGDGRTSVSLEHKGWPDGHPEFIRCNTRWGALLGQLKHYLEHGTTQKTVT
jgi:uncharacterized protein YndB with AHSA1/START domain